MRAPITNVIAASFRRRIAVAIAVGFAVFLAVIALVAWSSRELVEAERWKSESDQAIEGLQQALITITDAETGQRGYLLTGNEGYLAPYNAARQELPQRLTNLERLTANHSGERELLVRLRGALEAKLDELALTIRLGRERRLPEALAEVNSNRGRDYMQEVRADLAAMTAAEQRLRAEREEVADSAIRRSLAMLVVLGVFGLILLIAISLGFIRYVRDLAAATDALRSSEERCRLLVEEVRDYAIFMLDAGGYVITWNKGAERIKGYKAEEVLSRHFEIFYPPEDVAARKPQAELRQAAAEGRLEDIGWRVRKDGTRFLANVVVTALRNKHGELLGFTKVTRDITERTQLDEQLRQAQKVEAIARLAGGLAHDFNSLLTVITGYASMLLDELDSEDPIRAEVEEIAHAADRGASLIKQLLAYGRQQMLMPRTVDLNAVLSGLENILRRVAGSAVKLRLIQGEDLHPVKADPGQIEQVVLNLVLNARDAMPSGGDLIIETANVELSDIYAKQAEIKPGRYVMLSVRDTGHGITPEVRARMFDPFFTTKGVGRGTGLGLSTVQGIVKQSEGEIVVYSEPGKGATFKIYLPEAEAQASELETGEAELQRTEGGSEAVLVVEDNEAVRKLIARVLSQKGYRVLAASGAHEAAQLCEKAESVDLLISDISIPDRDGTSVAECVKRKHPSAKFLYISSFAESVAAYQGPGGGNTFFLQKPFDAVSLLRNVRAVLDGTRVSAI